MSIFEKIFGSTQQQPAQQQPAPQQQAQPGNLNQQPAQTPQQSAKTDANGVVPPAPAGAPESPMDQFKELWQPSDTDAKGPQPLINVDPKQIAEAARKTDFSKMISAEQLAAISKGGEEAGAAFMQAMNSVAQGVYAQSAFATSKIVEQAVAKARDQFNADIPAHVKKLQVSDTLRNENPVFNHPAASPILGAVEAQMTAKYPNASASEITSMAKQYLENFANAINAPKQKAEAEKAAKGSKETDWTNFLG
jgi:hypothetical protein